jgi:head-tail adaptor
MLTQQELTDLRAQQDATMTAQVVITRGTLVSDGMGGSTRSFINVGTVLCRWAATSAKERALAGRVSDEALTTFTMPFGTSVQSEDRLTLASARYDVVGVLDHTFSTACRAVATRV